MRIVNWKGCRLKWFWPVEDTVTKLNLEHARKGTNNRRYSECQPWLYRRANLLGDIDFVHPLFKNRDSRHELCDPVLSVSSSKGPECKLRMGQRVLWCTEYKSLCLVCFVLFCFLIWLVGSLTSGWWWVIVSNIIFMLYFLDPGSLILGLFHRNPNQPLWVTLAYVMSRGCTRISLYLNGSWTCAHALCHCLSRRGKEMFLHAIPFMFFFYTSAYYIFFILS